MILQRVVVITRDAEIQQLARKLSEEIFVADDLTEALDIIGTIDSDLIICDEIFGKGQIKSFLAATDKNAINVPVLILGTGDSQTDRSDEFIKIGAQGYLGDRKNYDQLETIVGQMKDPQRNDCEKDSPRQFFADDCAASVSMVGRSKATVNTLKMIKLVANSQCNPVLIVGETGTGKEMVAKAVHTIRHSKEPFVAINCAALTANLLESELFGHVKGSFTGADKEKTGLFELAGNGSIFLDEISEMPLDLQAKLLRVLQERMFRKVGGLKDIQCNATIIASSNRNLKKEVQENNFRRDLYYRLSVCPIAIAPLRSAGRRDDTELLAEYFVKTSSICPEKAGKITSFTKLAMEALCKHDWPGNVRELSNVIQRAILLETTDKVGLSSIVIDPEQHDYSDIVDSSASGQIKGFSLVNAERELISRALTETGWQKTRAASLLGITRATLYAKVKQYNIEKNSADSDQFSDEVPTKSTPELAPIA